MEGKSSSITKKKSKTEDYDYLRKIIIIGDSGVGKSNMLLRYSRGQFVQNYMMTIGINYVFNIIQIDGMRIKLQIWDTAGQDKYKTITQNYYKKSHGVIITFSIDSRQSFYSVRKWIEDVTETIQQTTPIILVGNKMDLEEEREVSTEEAMEYAQNNDLPYLECSAKSGQSVSQVFETLARLIKQRIIDPKIKQDASEVSEQIKSVKINPVPAESITRSAQKRCCMK